MYQETIQPKDIETFRKAIFATASEIDSSKIGYVGLIGTGLATDFAVGDLDVIVFPSRDAKVGEAIVAMNQFYDLLDRRLRADSGLYLATCPKKIMQAEVNHIIGETVGHRGKLSTHTLFFTDVRSYNSLNPLRFPGSVEGASLTIVGNPNVLRQRPELPQQTLEPYFFVSDFQIPLVSRKYPDILVLRKMEDLARYLRKNYGVESKTSLKTVEDCALLNDEILKELDARTPGKN